MAGLSRTMSLASEINVDLNCATVRFEKSDGPDGAGRLVVESRATSGSKADVERVIESMKIIARRGEKELSGLVAIYDLTCLPSVSIVPHIVGVVGPFSKEYAPILDKLFVSIAVVLQDSFWSAAARNAVNVILKIAPPKCPFLLTHRRDLAEDFVRTHFRPPNSLPTPPPGPGSRAASMDMSKEETEAEEASVADFRKRLLTIDGLDGCQDMPAVASRMRVVSVSDLDQDKVPLIVRNFSGNPYYDNIHFTIDEMEQEKRKQPPATPLSSIDESLGYSPHSPEPSISHDNSRFYRNLDRCDSRYNDKDALVCVLRIEKPSFCVQS